MVAPSKRPDRVGATITAVAGIVLNLRVTLFFYVAYAVVNYIYLFPLRQDILNYALVFAISPFNVLEVLSPAYGSTSSGLLQNFWFVVVFILLAEVYSRFSSVRLKRAVSFDAIFLASILASYTASAMWWRSTGVPGSGTSIVAFSMLLYLAAASMLDIKNQVARAGRDKSSSESIRGLIWVFALVSAFGFAPTYILGNPHYVLHIAGGLTFAAFAALFFAARGRSQPFNSSRTPLQKPSGKFNR